MMQIGGPIGGPGFLEIVFGLGAFAALFMMLSGRRRPVQGKSRFAFVKGVGSGGKKAWGCCGWVPGRAKHVAGPGQSWLLMAVLIFSVVGFVRSHEWGRPSWKRDQHFVHRSSHQWNWGWSKVVPGEEVPAEPVLVNGRASRVVLNEDRTTSEGSVPEHSIDSWETVDHWPASIYAAATDAWEGLGRLIVEQLDLVCDESEKAVEISVVEDRGPRAMRQIVTGTNRDPSKPMVRLLRDSGVTIRSERDRVDADESRCAIQVMIGEVKGGVNQLRAELKNLRTDLREEASVSFVEKPWVRQEHTVLRTSPNGREHWVVGRSGLEAEAKTAARAAREEAHEKVAEILERAVQEMGRLSPVEKLDLTDRIHDMAARLVKENLADEFEQEVSGEFVDAKRCAVLVNLDGETLGSAATNLIRDQRVAKRGLLQRAGAMGVMGVLIWLAYLFLNSGTRGHFVWKLRAGSVAGFTAVCLAIHYLQPF